MEKCFDRNPIQRQRFIGKSGLEFRIDQLSIYNLYEHNESIFFKNSSLNNTEPELTELQAENFLDEQERLALKEAANLLIAQISEEKTETLIPSTQLMKVQMSSKPRINAFNKATVENGSSM